jgi:ABC-type antimicrobial peptide transport system permease subunit
VKPQRSALLLAALFSAVALVLAAVGIYGALAFVVAQRQREIGVRLALGALPAQIRRLFLGLGVRVLLNGMIAGSIVAYWVGRSMHGLLFGVSAFDPPVFVIAAIVLGTAVFAASLIPSHRAAQVSPLDALRHE